MIKLSEKRNKYLLIGAFWLLVFGIGIISGYFILTTIASIGVCLCLSVEDEIRRE